MIAERDAKPRGDGQYSEDCKMEPIHAEMPQIERDRGQGEDERADQKRACRPIDTLRWNPEDQKAKVCGRSMTNRCRAAENYVFFCPGMNAATMRTSESLCFHLRGRPLLFFNCPTGIGQLGGRWATHEQAFQAGARFCLRPLRWIEIKSL